MAKKRKRNQNVIKKPSYISLDEIAEKSKKEKLETYEQLRLEVKRRMRKYQRENLLARSKEAARLYERFGTYRLPVLPPSVGENEMNARIEMALQVLQNENSWKISELERRLFKARETINEKLRERAKKEISINNKQLLEFLQSSAYRQMRKYEDSDKIIELFINDILDKNHEDSIALLAERFYDYATNEQGQFSYADYQQRKKTGKLKQFRMEDFV